MSATLSQEIQHEYDRLVKIVNSINLSERSIKIIEGTGGKVSVIDLIAYQIGWGKCLLTWYKSGKRGEMPSMPGDGFSSWDYTAIARHFYQSYHYEGSLKQMEVFKKIVLEIIEMVETEHKLHQLDKIGVWPWCTLPSGKQWPLSKWIRVNTVAPYKRASGLIKKV